MTVGFERRYLPVKGRILIAVETEINKETIGAVIFRRG